jgi:hypothetical protein
MVGATLNLASKFTIKAISGLCLEETPSVGYTTSFETVSNHAMTC